jgi:hypothetical protein
VIRDHGGQPFDHEAWVFSTRECTAADPRAVGRILQAANKPAWARPSHPASSVEKSSKARIRSPKQADQPPVTEDPAFQVLCQNPKHPKHALGTCTQQGTSSVKPTESGKYRRKYPVPMYRPSDEQCKVRKICLLRAVCVPLSPDYFVTYAFDKPI